MYKFRKELIIIGKEITNVSIDILKIHPRNTEFFDDISGTDYENFKKSIQEEGIISEIIVAPDMTIISGHQRYKAAKDLGINIVPVRIREDLIDEDKKLKVLLAANFGRNKNDESKQRKVAVEYVRLCGYGNGGDRKAQCQNGAVLTLDEIAKQLGTSKRDLQRALSIERNLTESVKELLDTGIITKTLAADSIATLSESEQEELISKLDVTKKYTQKQVQKYIDEIKSLKETTKNKDNEEIRSLKEKITKKEETIAKLNGYKDDYESMERQFKEKVSELQETRKELESIKSETPKSQYEKKIKDSAIFFCGRVSDFIEKMGGYVWLSDKIYELPEYERKAYINAVDAINAWSNVLLQNITKTESEHL